MAKAAKGESKKGLIITLVFSILFNIGLGVATYFGFAEQKVLEEAAKKAQAEQKAAQEARDWERFQNLILKAYGGSPLSRNDEQDLTVLRKRWEDGTIGKELPNKDEIDKLVKKYDDDPLLGWDRSLNRPKNTMYGQMAKLDNDLKSERARFDARDKDREAAIARLDSLFKTKDKDVKDRQNKVEELQGDLKKAKDDKSKEFVGALTQIETLHKEVDDLNKKVADGKAETDKKSEEFSRNIKDQQAKIEKLQSQVTTVDYVALDQPKGKVVSLDRTGAFAYINIGSHDNAKPQLTFSIFGKNADNKAKGDRKARLEVVNVLAAHLSMAKIFDISDPKANPVLTGDLIFNPAWNPTMREHIAIAGLVDLSGDGSDQSAEFMRDMEKQGIIVDLFLDLKTMTTKGKMTLRTSYLVLGEMPEYDRFMPLTKDDPKTERKTDIVNKLSDLQVEATKLGITVIPARRFMALIGYRLPHTVVPPDYTLRGVLQMPTENGGAEKKSEEKPKDMDQKKNGKAKEGD